MVAAGRVGSPFSHKALATGSTSTANGAGAGAPLLHLPSPPPQRCAALPGLLPHDLDLRPLTLDRHSRRESFLASAWVLPALQHSVQTSPPPGTLPGPPPAQSPEGPAAPWLGRCVCVRAELSQTLFSPSVFPSQASPTRRPVSTGVDRPPRNSQAQGAVESPRRPFRGQLPRHTPGRGPGASPVA